MTIAYAALDQTVCYRDEDTNLYVVAFDDGRMFFSRRPPLLYDRDALAIPMREVLPGSYVNVKFAIERGSNWMAAVQLVRGPQQGSPFDPITDDG